jgi:hypothetical protein
MFNLSTQEVVLSIENSPLTKLKGIVYQEYHNFFGNSILKELKNLENLNLVKLEKQFDRLRHRVDYNDNIMKKLKIFFMHSKITNVLAKKFNTELQFDSVDIWIDKPGYYLEPHIDDLRIKLAIQIYLGEDENVGTALFDKDNNVLKTFEYKLNSGYALFNNKVGWHGPSTKVENGTRKSMYVRYS